MSPPRPSFAGAIHIVDRSFPEKSTFYGRYVKRRFYQLKKPSNINELATLTRSRPSLNEKNQTYVFRNNKQINPTLFFGMQPMNVSKHDPNAAMYPDLDRALLAEIRHEIDAPEYWKVIEHIHRQAPKMEIESVHGKTSESADELTAEFAALTPANDKLDPANYPSLFGHDSWLSTLRLRAAGELFVSRVFNFLFQGHPQRNS